MEPTAKDRLNNEIDELDERIGKLNAFLADKDKKQLSKDAEDLLFVQSNLMTALVQVLQMRYEKWED